MALKINLETPEGLKIPNAYVQIYRIELKKTGDKIMIEYIYLVFTSKKKREEARKNHISSLRGCLTMEWNQKTDPFKAAYAHLKKTLGGKSAKC